MQKPLLKSVLATFGAFAVFKIVGAIVKTTSMDYIPRSLLMEFIFFLAAVAAAIFTKKVYTLKFRWKGMGAGFVVGWWFWFSPTLSFIMVFGQDQIKAVTVPDSYILMFLVMVLLIGITEELLFRGVLLNGCLEEWGEDSPAAIRKSIVIAGCVFGACHLLNVFSGASLGGAVIQAICNIPAGMLYGAIYIRLKKNMWPCIFLHAYNDMMGFISGNMLAGATSSSVVSGYNPALLVVGGVQLLIALFLMRNKKLEPLTVKNQK